jgi:DNA-binding HxlR family transcriptional regulator
MAKTKREYYTELRTYVAENQELVEFIDREIDLLNRKSSTPKKPTATQIENEGYKTEIVTALENAEKPMTIKEIVEAVPSISGLTNQRITHMLTALRSEGKVAREYVKKVPYFRIGTEEVTEVTEE